MMSKANVDFWKLFRGGLENWQMHLSAASMLVAESRASIPTPLTESALSQSMHTKLDTGQHAASETDTRFQNSDMEGIALRFFTTVFIWFDILSCASVRKTPSIDIHERLIEEASLQVETVMGCENWVLILIKDISSLDQWKRNSEQSGRLSVMELSRRASQIEDFLKKKIAEATKGSNQHILNSESSRIEILADMPRYIGIVTSLIAHSAMTYLYVVTSGAYPELEEIQESVSSTIDIFKHLPHPTLAARIVVAILRHWVLGIKGATIILPTTRGRSGY
jgi:hypothetical protein